jgi:hypothetical protein
MEAEWREEVESRVATVPEGLKKVRKALRGSKAHPVSASNLAELPA